MALLKLMEESEDRPEFTVEFVAELRAVLTDPWNKPVIGNKPVDWSQPGNGYHSIDWKPAIDLDQAEPMDWCGREDLLWRQRWYRSNKKRKQQEVKDFLARLNMTGGPVEPPRRAKERAQPY
jgi:hypothetical protein